MLSGSPGEAFGVKKEAPHICDQGAFGPDILTIEVARLTSLKEVTPAMRSEQKYSKSPRR
jgi:hypothetical protein